jgi:hypothetical protein
VFGQGGFEASCFRPGLHRSWRLGTIIIRSAVAVGIHTGLPDVNYCAGASGPS